MSNMILGLLIIGIGILSGNLQGLSWWTVVMISSGVGLFTFGLHEWYVKKGWA